MRRTPLALLLLFSAARLLAAQRLVVRPLVVPPGDTSDHVDLSWSSVPAHASATLVALVYDAAGHALPNQAVRWSSSDTTVATISAGTGSATVQARKFGSATIAATARGMTATITACVFGAAYPFVIWVLGPPAIPQGSSLQYTAVIAATQVPLPAPCVHWSTADSTLAAVTRRGIVTGRRLTPKTDVTAFLGVP